MNCGDLHQRIRNPLDWKTITGNQEVEHWLSFYWYAIVDEYSVDCESHLLDWEDWNTPSFFATVLDDKEIVQIGINVRVWIDLATQQYLQKVRRFSELRVANAGEYSKHYVVTEFGDQEVCEMSRTRGESILFPRFNPQVQLKMIWCALAVLMDEVLEDTPELEYAETPSLLKEILDLNLFETNNLRLPAAFPKCVGAASGHSTRFCLIKIDCATPIAHLHPITEEEAKGEGRVLRVNQFKID